MCSANTKSSGIRARLRRGDAEAELHRLNWALAAYTRSSTALMHFADFDELVARFMAAIVGEDEYLLAVVGLPSPDPQKSIRLMAGAGRATGYLKGLSYSWSEGRPEGQGPFGQAIRSGVPYVMRDVLTESAFLPWLARARSFGIRSSATVPFSSDGRVIGAVKVYSGQPDAFGDCELEVFSKLGRELAFALSVEQGRAQLRAAEAARAEAEEAARISRAELGRAARMMSIGEFASSIAHEVNQPVGAIMTNANAALRWLDKPTPDLGEVRSALQRIVRDADRTSAVIGRARAKLVKAPLAGEPLDINQVLREALLFTQGERGHEAVDIETDLDESLPSLVCDRVQLQQVAVNLFVNAMDAMRSITCRPRVLRVTSGLDAQGDVTVSVADTGCGLGQGGQKQAFEHFFTTKPDGLGLGLPISRSIIEGCGGDLTAAPNHPFGAIFTFTLPVSRP